MLLDALQQKSDRVHSTIYLGAFTHSAASLYWAVVAEFGNLDPNCVRSKSHGGEIRAGFRRMSDVSLDSKFQPGDRRLCVSIFDSVRVVKPVCAHY
jgi:hypothetical protein